jgi:hypothetical protein
MNELAAHTLSSGGASWATLGALLGGAGVAIAGKGMLRALALGVSSRYYGSRLNGAPVSQRDAEVASLRASLSAISSEQFVIVNGPRGVGECVL